MDVSIVSTAKAVLSHMAEAKNQVQQQIAVTELKDAIDSQASLQMRLLESGVLYDNNGKAVPPPQLMLNIVL